MRWRRRKSREQDLERELHSHLEAEAEEQRESGVPEQEARYAAKRALGNVTHVKEATRAAWGWTWMERFEQDVRFAGRTFRRSPGFAAVVILLLALGIGATAAIFSIVDAVVLDPLPYPNADRLVVIWKRLAQDPRAIPVFDSYADFESWKRNSRSFELLAPATWATGGKILTGAGDARQILAMPAGLDFFSLLGVKPKLGRAFQRDDLDRNCTVVLKHSFWIKTFGGQRNVIGRRVELNKKPCSIVGVMPPEFTFYPDAISLWALITPNSTISRDPKRSNVGVFGLLKRGVSMQAAQKEIAALYRNEHEKDPDRVKLTPVIYPLAEQFAYLTGPNLRLSLIVLFAAVVFVLLIACVNIANLLLGRSAIRERELAIRAALGSGRMRLIRQLMTEGMLLSFTGAAIGVLLAMIAVHYFRVLNPIAMPPGNPVHVDFRVLTFAAGLAVITAILFGLAPAWKACRIDLTDALKAGGRSISLSWNAHQLSKTMVVMEVTLSLALLAGAGLLIESVNRLASVPLGFRTDRVLSIAVTLPQWSYSGSESRLRFYRAALGRAMAIPGVESAAFATSLPLTGGRWGGNVLEVEGRPAPDLKTAPRDAATASVSSDYFRVMNVPLEQGRLFDDRDREKGNTVAIVNQALAQKYFGHQTPLGARVKAGESGTNRRWLTIVGVVGNEKDQNFFHQMAWEEVPTVFQPVAQDPPGSASLIVLTRTNDALLGTKVREQLSLIDPEAPIGEAQAMGERRSRALSYARFRASLFGLFSGLALLLAGIGLYGVLSQSIAQRTQEFGVRMALGAQRRDVLTLVIRQGLVLTAMGLGAGLVLTLCVTGFLRSLLYGVTPTDPWTLASVSLLLLLVALWAVYIPARRATKVEPMVALRCE